jgi:serine/threonine-protein kinase
VEIGAGYVIADRYCLESLLGKGGMGSVWKAEDRRLRRSVAVKLIDPTLLGHAPARARFASEAHAAASLKSPHIVQPTDYGDHEGTPYYVMELLVGQPLSVRLGAGPLSPVQVAWIVVQVSRALTEAHEAGLVHRDLKPDNIFLVNDDDEALVKVLDFGIAKRMDSTSPKVTKSGALVGTPAYMSPEQFQSGPVDHRADLWALGVLTFECLLGRRPFRAKALGELLMMVCVKDMPIPSRIGPVPVGFDEWFARALRRNPRERFQTARDMAFELRNVLAPDSGIGPRILSSEARIDLQAAAVANSESPASPSSLDRPAPGMLESLEPFTFPQFGPGSTQELPAPPSPRPDPEKPPETAPANITVGSTSSTLHPKDGKRWPLAWRVGFGAVLVSVAVAAAVAGYFISTPPSVVDHGASASASTTSTESRRKPAEERIGGESTPSPALSAQSPRAVEAPPVPETSEPAANLDLVERPSEPPEAKPSRPPNPPGAELPRDPPPPTEPLDDVGPTPDSAQRAPAPTGRRELLGL